MLPQLWLCHGKEMGMIQGSRAMEYNMVSSISRELGLARSVPLSETWQVAWPRCK